MRKVSSLFLCIAIILCSFPSLAPSRPAKRGSNEAARHVRIYNNAYDRTGEGLYYAEQADTYLLASYEFDVLGLCSPNGWQSVDRTAQLRTFFHVDSFRVVAGNQSMWCGARSSSDPELCQYISLPGYGNNWDQFFESVEFSTSGDVALSFLARYDSELGYDSTFVDYSDDGGNTWTNLLAFSGVGETAVSEVVTEPGSIKFRFHFQSDGGWSDEDGLLDTEGAFILDSLVIEDGIGTVDFQDFESEPLGATTTSDGDWTAYPGPGYGDFSGLFMGLSVLQEDGCTKDPTCLWGFFNGSTDDYTCGGHPEQLVVPYVNDRGQYLWNEIWSPPIEWTPAGVPATCSSATLDFWAYLDLPLDNMVFYTWRVRSLSSGCPMAKWEKREFAYYYPWKNWVHNTFEIADLVEPGATHVQISLAVMDLCYLWCGILGTGECHSHTPLFDRVKLYRINTTGPVWSVLDAHLFQDNFPADGTTGGTVRCDMAMDINPDTSPDIRPGDSLVVTVSEPQVGLGTDPTYGGAAVYIHVRSTGGQTGTPVSGDISRWPVLGVSGGWTKLRMDTVYVISDGHPYAILNRYCADLNDNLLVPPDRIDYYFSAMDANGNTTYWSREVGTTQSEAVVQAHPMEMQCLPTGESDILYVDDFDGRGAQPYFDDAFSMLGISPDRYDVISPSSFVGNGLGSRASASQIVDVYQKIIWSSGDLSWGTIGDGSGSPEKSPDAQILFAFLDQSSSQDPGLYITGDGIAEEMWTSGSPPFIDLFTYINYNLTSTSHRSAGEPVSPLVIALLPGTIFQHGGVADTLVAYGGCPIPLKDFDLLEAAGTAAVAMTYSGSTDPTRGAVLTQETTNPHGRSALVVLEGFSFHAIRDDRAKTPMDRVDHMMDILTWFGNTVENPTGAGGASRFVNELAQNYPNPFNPLTTIRFSLEKKGRVTLRVYNVDGWLVRTLLDEVREPGSYSDIKWNGLSNAGQPVSSGVYFYKLVTGDFSQTRKMVLVR